MTINNKIIKSAMCNELYWQIHNTMFPHEYHTEISGELLVLKMIGDIENCIKYAKEYEEALYDEASETFWCEYDNESETIQVKLEIEKCIKEINFKEMTV